MHIPSASSSSASSTASLPAAPDRPGRNATRRTQAQRSSSTQQRLCQAAVSLLSEVGYERLTTAHIAQRAGVSKGAQAHHYPTKDDILVAAFQHLLGQWEERREAFARRQGATVAMPALLQAMWRQVFGRPDYLASLEVMLAARHHPSLRDRLREVLATWTVARDRTFQQLVALDDPDELATFMQINFCVLRGLAVYEELAQDKKLPRRVLDMWSDIATSYIAQRPKPAAPKPARTPQRRPAP